MPIYTNIVNVDDCDTSLAWGKARKQGGSILTFVQVRVVYRSWTSGFDSDIPRVTISGRFCDWTGSRGLHELRETYMATIGTQMQLVSVLECQYRYTSPKGGLGTDTSPLVPIPSGNTRGYRYPS
ncbi:hypothetical protein GQ457_05G031310 [Hibiscus cannabinus]